MKSIWNRQKGETEMKRTLQQAFAVCMISLLSASMILPAFGEEESEKTGWVQEADGRWACLDSNGEKKTSTWVLGKDRNHYYLDDDGYMAAGTVVDDGDDIYYVDEKGVRVVNCWASQSNADGLWDEDVDTIWYYIGPKGKVKKQENHAYHIKDRAGEMQKYFFDDEGHMLSGWQKILNNDGNYDTYYLGNENQGYVHTQWQYLMVPDDPDDEILDNPSKSYDGYEMFYFGWDGKMKRSDESKLENGQQFGFDENGVMLTGWAPAIHSYNPNRPGNDSSRDNLGINRYYDEVTGIMATGWLYTTDPDTDGSGDPHWFYCDKEDGYLYNEGGKDSDGVLGWKKIDGQIYFFDDYGHLVTGLISTGDNDVSGSPFAESEFDFTGTGVIGTGGNARPAGIYYLSQNEGTLGQMVKGKRIHLSVDGESETYHFSNAGWAYANVLVDDHIYGDDGAMLHSDSGWEIFTMDKDIYDKDDIREDDGDVTVRTGAEPLIRAGETVIVNKSGKVKKKGNIKVEGTHYDVTDYVATVHVDEE